MKSSLTHPNWFAGRKVAIGTQHGKEKVIAPAFETILGVLCTVPSAINTDQFGTFSGEIERVGNPIEALRKKCKHTSIVSGFDLVIASEGSFGSHPSLVFVPADEEWMMLTDYKNELEITARVCRTNTNFQHAKITTERELRAFAELVQFPSHALVLKENETSVSSCEKGISSWEKLESTFKRMVDANGSAWVETDMRAHLNPTRMNVIEEVTHLLLQKIQSACPSCTAPGFSVTKSISGLQCDWCNSPTLSTKSHLYSCQKCNFAVEKKYPLGKQTESPEFCLHCNP